MMEAKVEGPRGRGYVWGSKENFGARWRGARAWKGGQEGW